MKNETIDDDTKPQYHNLNSKQYSVLIQVFHDPVLPGIFWDDIEKLFIAVGAEVTEGRGSRVRVSLNGIKAVYHRPHPERTSNKATVKDVRDQLRNAGVVP